MAALHVAYVPYASDGISAGGLFQWKRDTGPDRAYSLDPADYPRLSLFKLKGTKGSTAFLNALVWLVFDSVSTWRSMSQRADGLAEAHADAVLNYLNLVPDTDLTAFLKGKLVEWCAAAPKNDSRAPTGEESPGEGREGGTGGLDALYGCKPP